jgi:hypothetical protein
VSRTYIAVAKDGMISPEMEAYLHSPPADRPIMRFEDEPDVAIVEKFGVLPQGDAYVAKIATHDGTLVHLGTFPRRHTAMEAYDAAHALLGDTDHNLPANSAVLTTVRRRCKCMMRVYVCCGISCVWGHDCRVLAAVQRCGYVLAEPGNSWLDVIKRKTSRFRNSAGGPGGALLELTDDDDDDDSDSIGGVVSHSSSSSSSGSEDEQEGVPSHMTVPASIASHGMRMLCLCCADWLSAACVPLICAARPQA